jgi:hypothetical protein
MTEREWLSTSDPRAMIRFLASRGHDRSLWLFTVACFGRFRKLPQGVRAAMEATERYADGQATEAEMRQYNTAVIAAESADHAAVDRQQTVAKRGRGYRPAGGGPRIREGEARAQAALLREVAGNPFRPATFAPQWRTDTAVALAEQMYDSRDFSAMPILADALQEAGCESVDILGHCRGPGPHVRGCWVVDLVPPHLATLSVKVWNASWPLLSRTVRITS